MCSMPTASAMSRLPCRAPDRRPKSFAKPFHTARSTTSSTPRKRRRFSSSSTTPRSRRSTLPARSTSSSTIPCSPRRPARRKASSAASEGFGLTVTPVVAREPTAWDHARLLAAVRHAAQRLIGPLTALVIWHMASTLGWVDARFLPTPLTVLRTLHEWMFGTAAGMPYSGTWFVHAASSAYRVFGGFLIAAVFGVVLGSLIGWFRLGSDLLDPIIQMLRPIPITAWEPFAVLFFGIRDASAFFLIALGAFFPIVVNTAAGVAGTPKLLVPAARMLGIPPPILLPRVVLPPPLPFC